MSKPDSAKERRHLNLRDWEIEASQRLSPEIFDFFAGGANDEVTLAENVTAFSRIKLLPRVLRNISMVDLQTSVLGSELSMPVFVSPTAFHRLAHPEGERLTARAVAAAGTLMIVSMASTVSIEEIVSSAAGSNHPSPEIWFQLYIQPDLEFTKALIERVERAGCKGLVLTVDSPVFGRRERDLRNGFTDLPPGICCENMREPDLSGAFGQPRPIHFMPELSWEHLGWLRGITSLPIVLKGILHPEDASMAVKQGVQGIIVSNHGGRQLDTTPATIDALPAIADAVKNEIPILVDGGIRRGTDVIKALALGAKAVGIGRPVLWGLACAGEAGVREVLETLREELRQGLMLCGRGSSRELSSQLTLSRGPTREVQWV